MEGPTNLTPLLPRGRGRGEKEAELHCDVRERDGWRLEFTPESAGLKPQLREVLLDTVVAVANRGAAGVYRRSRHATTYLRRVPGEGAGAPTVVFIKVYDAPRGLDALKRRLRGSRAAHAARAAAALFAHGFAVARPMLFGEELSSGREMLMTEAAAGTSLGDLLAAPAALHGDGQADRSAAIFDALGAEVARLHRTGYIHGDLTPHNVFVAELSPPRFVFLDHDRTRRAFAIGRRRRQLRNLVQLMRFELPAMTQADRGRIVRTWAAGLKLWRQHAATRRAFRMLQARIARDRRANDSRRSPRLSTSAFPTEPGAFSSHR